MPPNVIQQAPNAGIASIQQGLASIQQLGQFLEQKRQFEEDQQRLNRVQNANWGRGMLEDVQKMMPGKSLKDVAQEYPGFFSRILQMGMEVDPGTADQWVKSFSETPYNSEEQINSWMTTWAQLGDSQDDPKKILKDSQTQMSDVSQARTLPSTSAADSSAGEKKSPAPGTQQTVSGTKQESPSTIRNMPTSEPITNAPPRSLYVLNSVKADLYPLIQGVAPGNKLAYQNSTTYNSILDNAIREHPADAAAIQELKKNLPSFIQEVQGGLWKPPVKTPLGTVGAPGSPNPPKSFEEQPSWISPENQSLSASPAPTPVLPRPATPPAPKKEPSSQDPLETMMAEWKDMFSDPESTPVEKVRLGQRTGKAMSPASRAKLMETGGGRQILLDDAIAGLSDPMTSRIMGLSQNPAAVYGIDLEAGGGTKESKIKVAAAMIDLQKKFSEWRLVQAQLVKAGFDGKSAQVDYMQKALTWSLIKEGGLLPDAVSSQTRAFQEQARQELVIMQKEKDSPIGKEALARYNQAQKGFWGLLKTWRKSLDGVDTPESQKMASMYDTMLTWEQNRTFLGTLWFGKHLASVTGTPQVQAAPVIPKGESDFTASQGLQ